MPKVTLLSRLKAKEGKSDAMAAATAALTEFIGEAEFIIRRARIREGPHPPDRRPPPGFMITKGLLLQGACCRIG